MNNEFFRITCEGIGIYEYFKKYLWNNISNHNKVWNNFIKSNKTNWLKKPAIYNDETKEYRSYFNSNGYEFFLERTFPLITKWIDNWKKNNWRTSKKDDVKNKELWVELDNLVNQHNINWNWVKGHAENEFNNRVDRLARNEIMKNQ